MNYKEVELPDGTVAEFPDNMSDDDIAGVLQQQFTPQQVPENPLGFDATPRDLIRSAASGRVDREQANEYLQSIGTDPAIIDRFGEDATFGQKARGALTAPAQGLTAGFADEIASRALALPALVPGGLNYEQAQQDLQRRMREDTDAFAAAAPISSVGLELAGGLTGASTIAKAAPNLVKGVTNVASRGILPAVAASGGVGAVSGGLYGAGTSEGAIQDRAGQAVAPALFSGIAGPAGLVAAKGAGPLASRAANLVRKNKITHPITSNIQEIAEIKNKPTSIELADTQVPYKVKQALSQDFPVGYKEALNAYKKDDAALVDLYGSKIRQLAKGVAQYPAGQKHADIFFNSRILKSPAALKKSIDENLSGVDAFNASADDILNIGREKSAPLYKKAYEKTVSGYSPQKEIQDAIKQARREYPTQLDGYADNSIKVLDYAKRSLDDQIGTAQRSGSNNFARDRLEIKNNLLRAMDKASPDYASARKQSGDYLSVFGAMEDGKAFMKLDPEILAKKYKGLGNREKDAFKIGVAKHLKDVVDKTAEGRNVYNKLFGTIENQKRLSSVLSPKQYKNLISDAKAQDRLFKLRNEVLGGSPTVSKAVAASEIAGIGSDIAAAANGGLNVASALSKGLSSMFDGLSDKRAGQIAGIIFEERPTNKLKIYTEIIGNKNITELEKQILQEAYFVGEDIIKSPAFYGGAAVAPQIPQTIDKIERSNDG